MCTNSTKTIKLSELLMAHVDLFLRATGEGKKKRLIGKKKTILYLRGKGYVKACHLTTTNRPSWKAQQVMYHVMMVLSVNKTSLVVVYHVMNVTKMNLIAVSCSDDVKCKDEPDSSVPCRDGIKYQDEPGNKSPERKGNVLYKLIIQVGRCN